MSGHTQPLEAPNDRKVYSRGKRWFIVVAIIGAILAVSFVVYEMTLGDIPEVHIPSPAPLPSPNAYDEFVAAGKAVVNPTDIDRMNMEQIDGKYILDDPAPFVRPATLARCRAIVKANAGALSKIRRGLTYRYQAPEPAATTAGAVSASVLDFLGLSLLLRLESQIKEANHDWLGACNSRLDSIELWQSVTHGAGIGRTDEAFSGFRRDDPALWRCIDGLNVTQTHAVIRRLEHLRSVWPPTADPIRIEEYHVQRKLLAKFSEPAWRFHRLTEKPGSRPGLDGATSDDIAHRFELLGASNTKIMRDYVRFMDRNVVISRKAYYTRPRVTDTRRSPAEIVAEDWAWDGSEYMIFENTVVQTATNLLITALALHAYHLQRGKYPTALSALAPDDLAALPSDPFASSGALRYSLKGSKYILYSVGPDGKDDGGTPVKGTDGRTILWFVGPDRPGDVVAGINE
jgi:hypothetical protein